MSKCGARNRKPVSQISDRAKRYRAHTPECKPDSPKRCFKCGSRRFVVPDHIDGDESNGRKSNLRWACKSHNTILGKRMAAKGKGKRTRQYNPKRRKNAGARSLGEYVSAAVSHTRGAHDEAGKVIHETPKSKRREFAREIWRRRGRNPAIEQIDSNTFRTDNGHGTVLTLKRKSWGWEVYGENASHSAWRGSGVRTFRNLAEVEAKYKAFRGISKVIEDPQPSSRKNPASPADELYRKFHGRGPDKITTMLVAGIDPYGNHPELTSLGPLIRLVVGEDVELNEEGEVKAADWVNEITFVPSMKQYRSITADLDPKSGEDLRKFKAWLKSVGAPDVAAVPNTRQLYFVGGNQNLDDAKLRELGADPEKDICDLGNAYLIEYFAQKRFDRFEPTTYFHGLGEVTGVQPRLLFMRVPRLLFLAGGEYIVTARGLEN